MLLLTLLAVGLLSLSTISLRGSSQGSAQAEARANARMALVMAIGQLQKHAGDDRRITVAADQLSADRDGSETSASIGRRYWTGVYDAWADETTARPEPSFRSWLVSDPTFGDESLASQTSGGDSMIRLVGENSAGELEEDWIDAPRVGVKKGNRLSGNIAWWTGDQGLKAMLATPPAEPAVNLSEIRGRMQAAPSHPVDVAELAGGGQPFRDFDRADPRLEALTDWPQSSLLASDIESPKGLFHDLATRTSGLLVDVRRGGFRSDLSMKLELESRSRTPEPLFRVNRETGITFDELKTFYQLPNELEPIRGTYTTGGRIPGGTMGLVLGANPRECEQDESFHFKMPALISQQVAFSLRTRPQGSGRNQVDRLYLVFDPILTFWNPHDVPLVIPQSAWMSFNFFQFPYTINITAGRQTWECPLTSSLSGVFTNNNSDMNFGALRVGDVEQLIFKPGEVIKVSQTGDMQVEGNSPNRAMQARKGFNYGGGIARPMRDKNGAYIDLNPRDTISYTIEPNGLTCGKTSRSGSTLSGNNMHSRHFGMNYNEAFVGSERPNAGGLGFGGMVIDFDFGNERVQPGSVRQSNTPGTKPSGERIYADRRQYSDVFPKFGVSETRRLSAAQMRAAKAPIMMYSYDAKTERDSLTGSRSMLRLNPRAHRIDFYDLTEYERRLKGWEVRVDALNSWVNRRLETSANGNGFFGGSYDAADGNSYVITHAIPREPIHSMAALQHSTANGFLLQAPQQGYTALNGRQPMMPLIAHAIGNSLAPSVLSPYETSRLTTGSRPVADHSYLANLELWDSWCFSSVAPQERNTYARRRAQRNVADDFLTGEQSLPVAHYKPNIGNEDTARLLARMFDRNGPKAEAVDLMASLIRVEGMFNVNSTSVEAWRVLLSSLLDEEIVTQNDSGDEQSTPAGDGVPVASLVVPNDLIADGQGAVPARDPAQWVGRRVLSEEEIGELAEAIVREVRRRGPFLSLADFVNRRVGSDEELARAGAIQAALDADEVSINEAYRGDRSVAAIATNGLPFPAAEEGATAAGIPGIVKQADILTPIAPILSARSDTFVIRAYGESVDETGKVVARAWCEALVERGRDYVTGQSDPDVRPDQLREAVDEEFGRRFYLRSFRWLTPAEV
ncbi:hypothetical protein HAHE_02330 [Haloferula helveola]|uniref:Uncharacterized protein n=2 Tax=Haloferula helveola TaxID=490095 RepID=A0ABN6H410_9BACT|nr:hypothetical protein HAHE_02330 [Haloferula helveola]